MDRFKKLFVSFQIAKCFICYQKMDDFEFKMGEIMHPYSPYKFDEDELPFDE